MSEYQEVETIIGKKVDAGQVYYCVKWKNMNILNSTWETIDSFADISKLKIMSRLLDQRCKKIRKVRFKNLKMMHKQQRKLKRELVKGQRKRGRRRKTETQDLATEDRMQRDIYRSRDNESVHCVFQEQYVVDIESAPFKKNLELKKTWEKKLSKEKTQRPDVQVKQQTPPDIQDLLHVETPEKFLSSKNVVYNFDETLNHALDRPSQDTSIICKRHSNQAVETLGLCSLKKKNDKEMGYESILTEEQSDGKSPLYIFSKEDVRQKESFILVD